MVTSCVEDREGNYYDEYGGGVSGEKSSGSTSHQEESETSESIMSLVEFAGIEEEDTTPIAPSQGDSDSEDIEEPTCDIIIDTSSEE